MTTDIQSLHFTANETLLDFVTKKVNELSHYHDKIVSADVYLKLDKSDVLENKVCEIKLLIPGHDLFAKKEATSFEAATVNAVEALHRQIEKAKG